MVEKFSVSTVFEQRVGEARHPTARVQQTEARVRKLAHVTTGRGRLKIRSPNERGTSWAGTEVAA